jgi:hypothetical protein
MEKPPFEHLIITRFNLKRDDGWEADKYGKDVHNEEWLLHRFVLFEHFCYPTMIHQKNQNFKWLVCFDADTPVKFYERINQYLQCPNFLPYFTSWDEAERHGGYIRHVRPDTQFLITTTLDNDDGLHELAISAIQNNFMGQTFEFINLLNGYVLDLTSNQVLTSENPSNNCISLVEKRSDDPAKPFKTVLFDEHSRLHLHGPCRQIIDRRYWLTTVHSKNLYNSLPPGVAGNAALEDLAPFHIVPILRKN